MMNDFALVIGIDDYDQEDKGLANLHGAKDDAFDVAKWLMDENGGGIEKENCHIVISNFDPLAPFHPQITKELKAIVKKAQADPDNSNRLYFYFAGHGVVEELEFDELDYDAGFCLANWTELSRRAALSARAYRKIFVRSGLFREIVILADCCRNPKIKVEALPPEIDFKERLGPHRKARLFIGFSSQMGEPSYEMPDEEGKVRGAFTEVLMEALRGGAVNASGDIDGDSLTGYLKKRLPEVTQRKYNIVQEPQIHNGFNDVKLNFQKKALAGKVECHIKLGMARTGTIYLVDEQGEDINFFDTATAREFQIKLPKGEYLLEDRNTIETTPISINPLLSTEIIEVQF